MTNRLDAVLWAIVSVTGSVALCVASTRRYSSLRILVTMPIAGALMSAGALVGLLLPPACKHASPASTSYTAPEYWVMDQNFIGHRIEELFGDHALLVLRRTAPTSGPLGHPHIMTTLREPLANCSWSVAEIFSDDDSDWQSFHSNFDIDGALAFDRMYGLIKATVRGDGARAYTMDAERWNYLHGDTKASTCMACFTSGRLSSCPSANLLTSDTITSLRDCTTKRNHNE